MQGVIIKISKRQINRLESETNISDKFTMNRFFYDNHLKFRLGRHVAFFLLTIVLFTSIVQSQNGQNSLWHSFQVTFTNAILFFSYAYITIFLLIPEFLIRKKPGWFLLLFVLVGVALSSIKLLVSDQIFYSFISPENMERSGIMNLRFVVVNTKDMTFIVALFCVTKYAKDFTYAEKKRKMLESETLEAKRKLFQAQFDPHFLFNTINNLYALSLLNPRKTAEVIAQIKQVLVYFIEEIQKEFVNLEQEVELAESYIRLEKLRYGDRLQTTFSTRGELHKKRIPPMILFLLLENSFKHGCSIDAGSPWINVEVKSEKSTIEISVENSKPFNRLDNNVKTESENRGNLKNRLDLIYGKNGYGFRVSETDRTYKVVIDIEKGSEIRRKTYR